jgi:hypothetical protein
MALAMTKLMFAGETAEVLETIKSNVRNIPQAQVIAARSWTPPIACRPKP